MHYAYAARGVAAIFYLYSCACKLLSAVAVRALITNGFKDFYGLTKELT
jgi:hypothetical protein